MLSRLLSTIIRHTSPICMNALHKEDVADELRFFCVFCGNAIRQAAKDENMCFCPECRRMTPVPFPAKAGGPLAEVARITLYPTAIFSVDIKFPCPKCKARLDVDARNAGVEGACPACGQKIVCPQLPAFLLNQNPRPEADVETKVIRLTAEELDFLNSPASPPVPTAAHAS